jgi:hypothetical protein
MKTLTITRICLIFAPGFIAALTGMGVPKNEPYLILNYSL